MRNSNSALLGSFLGYSSIITGKKEQLFLENETVMESTYNTLMFVMF